MKRALCYLRVSSEEQAKGDRYSLPEQERRLRACCEERGYSVVDVLRDAQSGRRDDRHAYQEMLQRLRRGEADVCVVRWLDRFGRSTREILTRIWELQDLGVQVEASDEDLSHELIRLIRAWQASEESRRIAERTGPALRARAAEGKWSGTMPFGYRYAVSGKPEIDPDPRCRAVDLGFRLYDPEGEALSLLGVCVRLNALGYRTPLGRPWTRGCLQKLLVNPMYCGDLSAHGVRIRDNHPARVSRELWERVQARLVARRFNRVSTGERPQLAGAGLVWCECGSRMGHTYTRGNSRVRRYGYWYCYRHYNRLGCDAVGISDLMLARALRERLGGFCLPGADEVMRRAERTLRERLASDDRGGELTRLEAELVRLRKVEGNLIDMRAGGEISRPQFAERVGATREQLARVEAELRRLRVESGLADLPRVLGELRRALALIGQGDLLTEAFPAAVGALVERITVRADRAVELTWRPTAELLLG